MWTNVKDGVPEKPGRYLVKNDGVVEESEYLNGNWMCGTGFVYNQVSHWKPLPPQDTKVVE